MPALCDSAHVLSAGLLGLQQPCLVQPSLRKRGPYQKQEAQLLLDWPQSPAQCLTIQDGALHFKNRILLLPAMTSEKDGFACSAHAPYLNLGCHRMSAATHLICGLESV